MLQLLIPGPKGGHILLQIGASFFGLLQGLVKLVLILVHSVAVGGAFFKLLNEVPADILVLVNLFPYEIEFAGELMVLLLDVHLQSIRNPDVLLEQLDLLLKYLVLLSGYMEVAAQLALDLPQLAYLLLVLPHPLRHQLLFSRGLRDLLVRFLHLLQQPLVLCFEGCVCFSELLLRQVYVPDVLVHVYGQL